MNHILIIGNHQVTLLNTHKSYSVISVCYSRSSKNETKEKMDKPFAISFVRLMQENGTTLRDKSHELLVYKVFCIFGTHYHLVNQIDYNV